VTRRRAVGRPPRISLSDIERVGVEIGLADLTVQRVAGALGVTSTALYRHIDSKFGLENVVGERILADLHLVDSSEHDTAEHLLSFAEQLREFLLANPGLSAYVQVLFPRGRSGAALLEAEIEALVRRGYTPRAANLVCTTVALLAIALTSAEENRRNRAAMVPGFEHQQQAAEALFETETLAEAHREFPNMETEDYFRYVISSCLHGILPSTGAPA